MALCIQVGPMPSMQSTASYLRYTMIINKVCSKSITVYEAILV